MNRLVRKLAIGMAVVLAVSVGPNAIANAVAGQATVASQETPGGYSTAEMLRGVVFNRGPVAQDLGIIVELPSELSRSDAERYERVVATLEESMTRRDGEALADARLQMSSGDPYQVELALAAYRDSFHTALDAEFPGVREERGVPSPRCGLIAVCAAVSVAAIALGAAIAVVAYNVAGTVNMIYLENGLWDEGSFTGASNFRAESGEARSVPQGLSATDTVRHLTSTLAGK